MVATADRFLVTCRQMCVHEFLCKMQIFFLALRQRFWLKVRTVNVSCAGFCPQFDWWLCNEVLSAMREIWITAVNLSPWILMLSYFSFPYDLRLTCSLFKSIAVIFSCFHCLICIVINLAAYLLCSFSFWDYKVHFSSPFDHDFASWQVLDKFT